MSLVYNAVSVLSEQQSDLVYIYVRVCVCVYVYIYSFSDSFPL